MAFTRRNPARSAAAGVLIALSAFLVPLAVAVQWAQTTLLDTDGYVAVADSLVLAPQVQAAVVDQVTTMAMDQLPALGIDAGPFITPLVSDAIGEVVRGDAFASIWSTANRSLHTDAIAVLDGSSSKAVLGPDGALTLDLSAASTAATEIITSSGLVSADQLPPISVVIPVLQTDHLMKVQGTYDAINTLATWLPWIVGLLLTIAVALAVSKPVGLAWAGGLTLAATGLAMLAAGPLSSQFANRLASPKLSSDLVDSVTSVFVDSLMSALRLGLIVGAALVLASVVVAMSQRRRVSAGERRREMR